MAGKRIEATDVYVGQRVRTRRMQIEMSQEELGKRLQISFQQVQKYEKGANRVSASRLQQIANILDVPVAFFFDGSPGSKDLKKIPHHPSSVVFTKFVAEDDGMQIMKVWELLTSTERRAIGALAQTLAKGRDKS